MAERIVRCPNCDHDIDRDGRCYCPEKRAVRFRPLRDRILVKPANRVQSALLQVVSGEKYNLGRVVAIGPKVDSVRVGDQIRFGESRNDTVIGFQSYFEDGERYLVMQEADVCFVEEMNGAESETQVVTIQ